ncbi:hypothetical protein A2773_06190 [Candidatus Gottesmanbacteria bacterium RIFCSPHIGHO2_01_FULL_39_10]|uniref:Transport permease protein n=1 Tax=Candidatus Gottesmanbacteria bacterium RIFCSPHIGHO2_01_FULL_39_10 TaxID=1798375 RepID=A0A1F5ZMT1_9BACT|nr:MAG: hypothetical protein A2773_06190 [Candidatus Gottesmanbacteria bacterium RIFCSPHIGHO2_01_FULL_39_10]
MNKKFERIIGVIVRHLYVWPKNLGRFTDSFFWPVINLFVWGYVGLYFNGQIGGVNYVSAFLTGYLLWMFLQRSQEEISIGLLEDLWNRNFINIFATPITIWEYLIGLMITGIFKLTLAFGLLSVVAFIFFKFNIYTLGIYLLPFILSLLLTGWWLGLIINGTIIRLGYDAEALGWTVVFILMPFSGVYYPLSILPSWMQSISSILPSSYVFEGMRNLVLNGFFDLKAFAISMILNAVYIALALFFYKKMFDVAKEKGYLVKLF